MYESTQDGFVDLQDDQVPKLLFQGQVYDPEHSVNLTDQLVFLVNKTTKDDVMKWKKKYLLSLPAVNYYLSKARQADPNDYDLSLQGQYFQHESRKRIKYASDIQATVCVGGIVEVLNIWNNQDVKTGDLLCLQLVDTDPADLPKEYVLNLCSVNEPASAPGYKGPGRRHQLVPVIRKTGIDLHSPQLLVVGRAMQKQKRTTGSFSTKGVWSSVMDGWDCPKIKVNMFN